LSSADDRGVDYNISSGVLRLQLQAGESDRAHRRDNGEGKDGKRCAVIKFHRLTECTVPVCAGVAHIFRRQSVAQPRKGDGIPVSFCFGENASVCGK